MSKRKSIKWEAKGAENVKKAKIGKREYEVMTHFADEHIPFTYFFLMAGGRVVYQASPTLKVGIYEVTFFPSTYEHVGYAKIDNDALVSTSYR